MTGNARFVGAEVENQVDITVTVHIRFVPLAVRFVSIAQSDGGVIHRRSIEGRRGKQVNRSDAVAAVAEVAPNIDCDGNGAVYLQHALKRVLLRPRQRIGAGQRRIRQDDIVAALPLVGEALEII